jgi:hypothetical protein
MPEELNDGDRIKVIGACVIPDYTVWSLPDPDYEIKDIVLKMHPYGSIIKIPR